MMDTKICEVLTRIPYAQTLGIDCVIKDGELTLILPYKFDNVGNPILPALHGGMTGGFMETAAIMHLMMEDIDGDIPKPIGLNIDYLRRGKPETTYSRAEITKKGSRVVNVRVRAWQEDYDRPIATLSGHFLTAKALAEE